MCSWFFVEWKYRSTDWVAIKDIKYSHPVELTEYYISEDIQHKLSFSWWVSYTINKWDSIWGDAKSNYWSITYKYLLLLTKYTVK